MRKRLSLIGQRFGRLTVVEMSSVVNNRTHWNCHCDCGKNKIIIGTKLTSGRINSCGCLRPTHKHGKLSPKWQGYEDISGNYISRLKKGAKKRNLDYLVTPEYLWEVFLKQNKKCALSGLPLTFNSTLKTRDGTASLDRINSVLGYVEGNIQWLHKDVNWMKNDFDEPYLLTLCKEITRHSEMKNIS